MPDSTQLTANANYTEAYILSASAYHAQNNPTGVKNGEIFFATDTKKVFLGVVDAQDNLTWRVLESINAGSTSDTNPISASAPACWYDAGNTYSNGGVTTGVRMRCVKDMSGNDYHMVANHGSSQFTLSRDDGVYYFGDGGTADPDSTLRYRCVDSVLNLSGLRIGGNLAFNNGGCSGLVVFKLKSPYAMGTGDDQSGLHDAYAHSLPYEEIDTVYANESDEERFWRKMNCKPTDPTPHSFFPWYSAYFFGRNYVHASQLKYGGGYYWYAVKNHSSGFVHPRSGIFNNCHLGWNTLFFRSAGGGKAAEILLNGRNFIALSSPMVEGSIKADYDGNSGQALWVTSPPGDKDFLRPLNTKWELPDADANGVKTTPKSEYIMHNGYAYDHAYAKFWRHPYVEPGYEWYVGDNVDGTNTADTDYRKGSMMSWGHNNTTQRNGLGESLLSPVNRHYGGWYNSVMGNYNGNMPYKDDISTNDVSVTLANNQLDLTGTQSSLWSENIMWNKRISDDDRDAVLKEIHAKYQANGGAMPQLPGGNTNPVMMPSKNSFWESPWV